MNASVSLTNQPLKMAYNSSYARLNVTQNHANGWAVVMLKNGAWTALDSDTLHNTSTKGNPPTVRAYFNAHLDLEFMPIVPSMSDNLDLFSDMPVIPVENQCRTVKRLHGVNIYEFEVSDAGYDINKLSADDLEAIKIVVERILRDTTENTSYARTARFDTIAMPATKAA